MDEISKLKQQIAKIEPLKKILPLWGPEFQLWKKATEKIVKNLFGNDGLELFEQQQNISFSAYEEENQEYYLEELDKRKRILEGLLAGSLESSPDHQAQSMNFYDIHEDIKAKCFSLYESGAYAEAVEKSFKVVRDKLRNLTGHETGSDAFGKGKLHIKGAVAANVDSDFNQGVKFLTMAIDMFRNEKSHSSDAKIDDPIRARQYLAMSSLALSLLENSEILP